MKNAKNRQAGFGIIEIILVVVILAIVGVVGFTIYNNSQKQSPQQANSTPQASNPHADWQTYTSEKEGLSISYPATWTYANTKTADVFDRFTLTGPEGFVIHCTIATIPLDGGEGGRKVEFVDELPNANYTKPLYVVGHYSPEYDNSDTISVTDITYTAGESDAGPRGYFKSKITEKMGEMGSNYVYLEGVFPTIKTAEGYDASPAHKDFAAGDLKVAREILSTVTYK